MQCNDVDVGVLLTSRHVKSAVILALKSLSKDG